MYWLPGIHLALPVMVYLINHAVQPKMARSLEGIRILSVSKEFIFKEVQGQILVFNEVRYAISDRCSH